jgi:hypothetical protein
MKKLVLILMTILLIAYVAGCGGGGGNDDASSATLQSITVSPSTASIAKGQSQQFTATGTYSDGTVKIITTQVTWSSDNASVTIGSNGLAIGAGVGGANITASLDDASGTASLAVTAAILTDIDVEPQVPIISLGLTQQFTATGIYTDGNRDLTNVVTWTAFDTDSSGNLLTPLASTMATIDSSGLATSVSAGSSLITATYNGISGNSNLTVTSATLDHITVTADYLSIAIGVPDQFYATAYDTDGNYYDVTALSSWSSSSASATVNSGSGLAMGVSAGSADISASYGGKAASATLEVTSATLSSLAVIPSTASIAIYTQQQFEATVTDTSANTYTLQPYEVAWSSSNTGVATISNVSPDWGNATGAGAGSTTIRATLGSLTNTAALTVTNARLSSITILPANSTAAVGWQVQFTATGNFSDGTFQDLTKQVTWLSSANSVARVSNAYASKGLATPRHTGTTTISAIFIPEGVSGSTQLIVGTATLSGITVTCTPDSINVGKTSQCTATGNFGSYTKDITNDVNTTWTAGGAGDTGVATVVNVPKKSKGLAKGISSGDVTIKAKARKGTTNGTTTLTVN